MKARVMLLPLLLAGFPGQTVLAGEEGSDRDTQTQQPAEYDRSGSDKKDKLKPPAAGDEEPECD